MNKIVIILFGILSILSYSSEAQIITCCENCYRKNSKIKNKNYDWDKLGTGFNWNLDSEYRFLKK
ncbi:MULTISPECIES: hypothetical protein [unclassified Leptotrichia]|jgi:hypothetical protein|uniref:hypothetical protein n=1 Tax=unclassified Leptotrichia TaxID=2633022 RepID=UPI0003AD90DF|nr:MULTISPECIES: hypothetical protein [unclassified Leptotrichia]ERL26352.1 hypothetical protein HMPREF9108_01070 [Leptotrichia sp. oral taxon 225 str. F0581]WLD73836.1 hypothetical protein QU666_09330 [Leptotrichia sp. HMT-225]